MVLALDRSTSASLPAQSFWDTFRPKNKDDMRNKQAQRALARQRLLTLAYGDMETVRMLPNSYAELDAIARDWIKPPPEAVFSLRVPVEYASLHATRWVSGPNIYLTGEDSYQIAVMGVQGLRVEIVSGPPPPPDSDEPPPPPPPPEMPATSSLELTPGEHVALDIINSDELDVIDPQSYPNGANAIYTLLNKVGPNACFYLKHDHSIQLPQLILYVCHCLQKSISSSQTHLIFPMQYPVGYSGLFQWVDIKTEDFIHWLCRSTCGNVVLPLKEYVHSTHVKTEDFCRNPSGNIVLPPKDYVHSIDINTEDFFSW
ncbi:uncharacterized protein LACBIDRAFT_328618 [Laccaria bicolor S238N-H82]|uniref:Predicted protein n=1 Tax=Laccaria bicolor (strain S238N-H82 / ATCC MYA-4686) TaxID=486041 RepID=B0DFF9_LACBS|nr:uncharacterized protein LACBIDRAFT_328618 [Laccaria bicolor S238N-H82]EDR06699.1 predicted protein [Laccaria bicolor S238N-H82]|eukprot:XP_001882546.1 predicted protein [Laccaria bicolor S238N-H82]